jgi:hypothetical protein
MKICPNCQEEIRNDAAFCNYCGTSQSTKPKATKKDDSQAFGAGSNLIMIIGGILLFLVLVISLPLASNTTPSSTEDSPISVPTTTHQAVSTKLQYSYSTIQPTRTPSYRPVTWMELVSFLSDDHTNWNEYIPGKYVCLDFAIDLVENAEKRFIKAWIVGVDFSDNPDGHAFVAFETSDRGTIYVEPQGDNTYSVLEVGKPLCDDWGMYKCMGKVASFEYMQCQHSQLCLPYKP